MHRTQRRKAYLLPFSHSHVLGRDKAWMSMFLLQKKKAANKVLREYKLFRNRDGHVTIVKSYNLAGQQGNEYGLVGVDHSGEGQRVGGRKVLKQGVWQQMRRRDR